MPKMRPKTPDQIAEDEQRIRDLETVLVQLGEEAARRLNKQWKLTRCDFSRLVAKAKENIQKNADGSGSYRRAAMLRKAQIAVQRAMDEGKWAAAAALMGREMELSSGISNYKDCESNKDKLGAPPDDPNELLVYTRRAMALNLPLILGDPSLSTKERTILLNDTCAKLGLTHDRAKIERQAAELEGELKAAKNKAPGRKLPPGGWKNSRAKRNAAPHPPRADRGETTH